MADTSDDFFSSFGDQDGSRSTCSAPPRINARASLSSSLSSGAVSNRTATSLAAPPPPPPRPTAANANSSATTNAPTVLRQTDTKVRSTVRPVASRTSRPTAASSAARPLSRTAQSVPNPATEATTGSSASGSGAYYGGAVPYNAAATSNTTASTAAISSATSGSSSQSFPYYTVPPSAPAAAAPSPYGNYGASTVAPPPPAAATPVAYNYAAPAATAPSAAFSYGQSGMNPYLLTSTAPANAFSGTMDTNAAFTGPMDTSAQHSMFIPQQPAPTGNKRQPSSHSAYQPYNSAEFDDDPPLLEELGINVEHIVAKTRSVVLPFSRFKGTISDAAVIQDADLAGPIALGLLLGGELMLSGKLQFGYIYGFGLFGCVSMTLILNFMSPAEAISCGPSRQFWDIPSYPSICWRQSSSW
ncbi:hypothetical protein MHU86_14327 [Fragilaria crotonensis]|nr:hypothetical protein MHU86_14327 [Fragilaria crotonensis]